MSTAEAAFNEMTKVKPWTSVDFQRFWARANELGWKKDEVHTHFGLESMKDFNGSLDDALAMLESPAAAEPVEDFPPEDETYEPEPPTPRAEWYGDAPLSFNVNAYEPGGFDVQFTVRDTDTASYLKRVQGLLRWMSKNGYRPKYGNGGGSNGRKPQAAQQAQTSGDSEICPIHHVKMNMREKNGETWYSHKAVNPETGDDYWCRGKK